MDLKVFGSGIAAFESGFPESLDLLLRWLRDPAVGAAGPRYAFPPVPVVPRPDGLDGDGPPVVVACTSPNTVRLAAERGLPMLLGMHCGDEDKAGMVELWRETALRAGHSPEAVAAADHVSAGVVQIADTRADAAEILLKTMPGWFQQGLAAHRTHDGRPRTMRDPLAYTELLCALHPVGTPRFCADRLAATSAATGITRFALLAEGSGDFDITVENVHRLGGDVLPELA